MNILLITGKIAHQRKILLFECRDMKYDKTFGTIKNYIKTIVQCTIKVKWILDKQSKGFKIHIGSEMLTCGGMVKVVNELKHQKKSPLCGYCHLLIQLYQPAHCRLWAVTKYTYGKKFYRS
jgi:hypothetical protein